MTEPKPKPEPGTLVPSPSGHGMLRYGSKPGMNGGGGKPKDEIRRMLREWAFSKFDETPELLQKWGKLETGDKLRALDMALRYGVGTQVEAVTPEDVAATAQRMLAVLVDELTARGWPAADVQALAAKCARAALAD